MRAAWRCTHSPLSRGATDAAAARRGRHNARMAAPRVRPPLIAADPDARMLRSGWLIWAVLLLFALVLAWRLPAEALPLLAVLGGLLLLWPLWRGGRWLWQAIGGAAHADWQGRYFEYDGRQIRILEDDLGDLWIAAADVFDALNLPAAARDPARVRLAAGREGLRAAPGTRLVCFTERGLAAWLERRSGPQVAAFDRWLRTQVLVPHHRKRERAAAAASTSEPAQESARSGRADSGAEE